jgi:hypothetical protein
VTTGRRQPRITTPAKCFQDLGQRDSPKALELARLSAFLAGVRSRKASDLEAEAIEGHRSPACCHMANVSDQLGKQSSPEAIRAAITGNTEMADAFERCREYLRGNFLKRRHQCLVSGCLDAS